MTDDPKKISNLVSSQYVELPDIVLCFSEIQSVKEEEARNILNGYGLSSLRPLVVQSGSDWTVVKDTSNKQLTDAIIHRLGGLLLSALSEDAKYYSSHCEFHWGIPTLVNWCHCRKLPVPGDWSQWMNHTYHMLNDRGLISGQQGTVKNKVTTGRQEARKRKTKEKHLALQKEYKKLKRINPRKPDTWIANQIARNKEVAGDYKVETIRRIMKD